MATRSGGADRTSTKAKLASELRVLGETIAAARERGRMKQSEVAARLGLPASHLSKVESGTRRLDVIELLQLAEAMEIDPCELVRELQQRLRDAGV
jgi:transcriptional regulator with XRE-family HTH domain